MTCDFGHRLLAVVLISGLGMLASGQPAARAQDSTSEPASDYSFTLSPYTGATHKLVSAPIGARLADFKPASPRGDVTESHRVARADIAPPMFKLTAADAVAAGSAQPTTKPAHGHAALAEEATNPLANLMQFQIQNSFVPSSFDSSGFSHALEIQPVIPYKLFDHLNILRLTVPVVLTPDFDGPVNETSGLGDTSFLNVTVFPTDWGNVALGFNTVFPTATDARLGSGKWQAGPAVGFMYEKIPKWLLGALFFNNWSYATNRSGSENVNAMSIQWFVIRHFEGGWYAGWGDLPWEFNWRNGRQNIPLNARVGKIVHIGKLPVNIFVQPFYTVAHDGPTPEWGVKLNVTLLFPE